MFNRFLFATALAVASAQASALVIVADSDLSDWLAAPKGVSGDWTPIDSTVKFAVEDQRGGANYYLDPGWGGQPYDAEAIYVHRSETSISIAVVTGRAPGASGYAAGDLAIDFGLDGTFEYGVVTLGDSTGVGVAGELYSVTEWNYGLWVAPRVLGDATTTEYGRDHPTSVKAGSKVADVALSYQAMTYKGTSGLPIGEYGNAGQHYVIEAVIDTSLLDTKLSSESFLVHWTMSCNNDWIEVDPPAVAVPSPAPLALMAAAMALLARRKRS